MKITDPLIILYDSLCKEHNVLEEDYLKKPNSQKREILTLLKSEIYRIDRKLQER